MVGLNEMRNKRTVKRKKEEGLPSTEVQWLIPAIVRIPHAMGQRSPSSTTAELVCSRARALQRSYCSEKSRHYS